MKACVELCCAFLKEELWESLYVNAICLLVESKEHLPNRERGGKNFGCLAASDTWELAIKTAQPCALQYTPT